MKDSGSRNLLTILALAIVASVAYTYWDTMVREDFIILNDIEEEEEESSGNEKENRELLQDVEVISEESENTIHAETELP